MYLFWLFNFLSYFLQSQGHLAVLSYLHYDKVGQRAWSTLQGIICLCTAGCSNARESNEGSYEHT